MTRILLILLTLLTFTTTASAQLVGTDIKPGDTCTAAQEGHIARNASADRDVSEITLICDGTQWQSATGGGGLAALQGQDDTGPCTVEKDGLIRYRASGNPKWDYCDGGTTSWLPFRLPQCQNDGTGECTLSALRSMDDAQFVASNILNGINILGVTGSASTVAPACTNDSTAECTLSATRSSGDPQFAASKIQCGENILGVTGTFGSGNSSSFNFTDATNVNPSTLTTASTVTISGLPAGCPGQVAVSGQGNPQISIAGGAWSAYGTIANGQTLAVRLTSNASFSTANTATVSVGATQDTWSVTTRAGDSTPDAFNFSDLTGVELSTLSASTAITPSGYEIATTASVTGSGSPQISINGGAWTTSGTISPGQTIAVRLTSSASFSTALSATVSIGGISDIWSVTTRPAVTPGSQTYSTAGSFNFTVPNFNSLTVEVWGGGGSGAGGGGTGGNNGASSSWNGTVVANGGTRGLGDFSPGSGGTASGGDTNTTGGNAQINGGGNSPNGGLGGPDGVVGNWPTNTNGLGQAPGGGGAGHDPGEDGGGGGGGYSRKTYSPGQLTVGASIGIVVGAGGAQTATTYPGAAGQVGRVSISWN